MLTDVAISNASANARTIFIGPPVRRFLYRNRDDLSPVSEGEQRPDTVRGRPIACQSAHQAKGLKPGRLLVGVTRMDGKAAYERRAATLTLAVCRHLTALHLDEPFHQGQP